MSLGFPFDREPATSDGVEARAEALVCREREPREDALLVAFRAAMRISSGIPLPPSGLRGSRGTSVGAASPAERTA